jgi:OOP family OmpA-OmpF porin
MMRKHLMLAVVAVAMIAGAGCTDRYLGDARSVRPQGTAFDQALYKDYLALAEVEYKQGDQRDGDTYARRAIDAAKGKPTQPDEPRLRDLPDNKVAEATTARQRLVKALDANGRTTRPDVAARAQSTYDCWLEQLDENLQPDHIAACRDAFNKALAQLEAPLPAPAAAPAPPMTTPDRFLVFFDFDQSTLTANGKQVVANAAAAFKKTGAARIVATGYTDRAGTPAYNQRLSERRAAAVKAELTRLGIPATQIATIGKGEENPLVPTADGVREPQNRRVEITSSK